MTALCDVLDLVELSAMLKSGFVRARSHPSLPLTIFNYTQAAQFDKVWNHTTRTCRGLIVEFDSPPADLATCDDLAALAGRVIARPFAKFFNLSEHAPHALPSGPVHVTDKLDGSLGIIYATPDGPCVATRGAFASEQAAHASRVLHERYPHFAPPQGWTFLVEVIYPGNRVVVDYDGLDDLVLLGAVVTATGASVPLADAAAFWPGPVVAELGFDSLDAAVAAPAREGLEGMVVHFTDADVRVKVKYDEYVRLHRIVTDVSERRVWEALSAGDDLSAWLEAVPDECFAFVTRTRNDLEAGHAAEHARLKATFAALVASLPDGFSRAEFAAAASRLPAPSRSAMFLLLDGKSVSHLAWRPLRPVEHDPLWGRSADAD